MNTRIFRRIGGAIGTAALLSAVLAAPTAAVAAPVTTEDAAAGLCQVDEATLGWGMKESFRTYITGSFANGSWETGEGVTYVEPSLSSTGAIEEGTNLFEWEAATGEISSTLDGGTVSFEGNVFFSGHGGRLSLNIGDPAIEFSDPETAYLLLAIGEAEAGAEVPQVKVAKIDLAGTLEIEGDTLGITDATVVLTSEGAEAFNGDRGTYASGDEMDPIYLNATVSGCELGSVAVESPEEDADAAPDEEVATPMQEGQQDFPWLPIIIGGIALVVVAVAATLLIVGRPKKSAADDAGGVSESD